MRFACKFPRGFEPANRNSWCGISVLLLCRVFLPQVVLVYICMLAREIHSVFNSVFSIFVHGGVVSSAQNGQGKILSTPTLYSDQIE